MAAPVTFLAVRFGRGIFRFLRMRNTRLRAMPRRASW